MESPPAFIFFLAVASLTAASSSSAAAAEGHYAASSRPVYSESVWHISPAAEGAPAAPAPTAAPTAAPREERGKSFSASELRGLFRSSGWRFNCKIAPPKWPLTST